MPNDDQDPRPLAQALVTRWEEDSGIHNDYYSTFAGDHEELLVERIADAIRAERETD